MVFERTSSQSTVNVICETGDKPIMSSVAVNCCSVPQNWSTMPSDVINTISQPNQTLVVEDNERAAKADGVTKELPHINGGPVPRSFAVHVQAAQAARHKFTIPRVPTAPAFPTFVPNAVHSANAGCSGDTVDTSPSTLQVKTKLKSFTDGKEYYHDARFLQTEICNSHLGSSGEPIERDDEGEHPRDDNVHPRRPDLKEGSAMYVDLPQKPLRADVQHVALEMLVDRHNDQPKEHKCLKHPHNNNKEYEEEESSCIVECLYCCIQCCDCSIM